MFGYSLLKEYEYGWSSTQKYGLLLRDEMTPTNLRSAIET